MEREKIFKNFFEKGINFFIRASIYITNVMLTFEST